AGSITVADQQSGREERGGGIAGAWLTDVNRSRKTRGAAAVGGPGTTAGGAGTRPGSMPSRPTWARPPPQRAANSVGMTAGADRARAAQARQPGVGSEQQEPCEQQAAARSRAWAGGSTPCASAQATFSARVKQQQSPCQQSAALAQPHGRPWHGN